MPASRFVVTIGGDGKSAIAMEAPIQARPFSSVPGFDPALLWGTGAAPSVPWGGRNITAENNRTLPEPGGTRLLVATFPPDVVMTTPGFDPDAAREEYLARLPGLAELFE